MDYLKRIPAIVLKLREVNENEKANRVQKAFDSAFTSTELLGNVTHELLEIVKSSKNASDAIGADVVQLRAFCTSIGITVW